MRLRLPLFVATSVCLSIASCTPFTRQVPSESMESARRPATDPVNRTGALTSKDRNGTGNPDEVLVGPPAQREMESRRSRLVRSSIGFEDGARVITVYYNDGSAGVTKDTSWGKVYEFHPAPSSAATTPAK